MSAVDKDENFQDKVKKALENGESIPEFPAGYQDDSSMNTGGIALHEVYTSFINGGFSSTQALYLAGCSLTGSAGFPPPRFEDEED